MNFNDRYQTIEILGKDLSDTIFKVKDKNKGYFYALKIIEKKLKKPMKVKLMY